MLRVLARLKANVRQNNGYLRWAFTRAPGLAAQRGGINSVAIKHCPTSVALTHCHFSTEGVTSEPVTVSQPLRGRNFFDVFGIPRSFRVDEELLAQVYRDFQRQFHPDLRNMNDDDVVEDILDDNSAYINHAFTVLQSPYDRVRVAIVWQGHARINV